MVGIRFISALMAFGAIAAGGATGTALAEDAGDDQSVAVGSGVYDGAIAGFTETAATNDAAAAAVIALCQAAGAQECTSDEVTNDNVCIVSVASDANDVVAGGAGVTIAEAKQDAFNRAAAANSPLDASAVVIVAACP